MPWAKVRGNPYSVCCGLQECLFTSVGGVREDGCAVNGALTAIAQGQRSMSQDEEDNFSDEVVGKFRLQVRGQDCLGVVNECWSREQSKSGVSPDTLGK